MAGDEVWDAYCAGQIDNIRDYCETDVVNTYLLFCRFQKMRGLLSTAAYAAEMDLIRQTLQQAQAPHWRKFLAAWASQTHAADQT